MKEKIRDFIAETTFTEKEAIGFDTLLFEDGIFDSMGLLNLISFLEEEFKVSTDDVDLNEDNFKSIDAIIEYIERKSN